MRAFNICAVTALALASLTAGAQHLGPVEVAKLPSSAPTIVEAYGADPLQSGELRLPLKVPQVLIASSVLTEPDAATFKTQATAKGDTVNVLTLKDAGHFDMLAPADASWTQIEQLILHSIADAAH